MTQGVLSEGTGGLSCNRRLRYLGEAYSRGEQVSNGVRTDGPCLPALRAIAAVVRPAGRRPCQTLVCPAGGELRLTAAWLGPRGPLQQACGDVGGFHGADADGGGRGAGDWPWKGAEAWSTWTRLFALSVRCGEGTQDRGHRGPAAG